MLGDVRSHEERGGGVTEVAKLHIHKLLSWLKGDVKHTRRVVVGLKSNQLNIHKLLLSW